MHLKNLFDEKLKIMVDECEKPSSCLFVIWASLDYCLIKVEIYKKKIVFLLVIFKRVIYYFFEFFAR